ncbi:MAG: lytic transglycosylase domain-containing protein [Deltaproteobacteria bacterium]|nr:lytic transglycosylase domain-containing protein [Deltaproteobacteria bacterium]
MKKIFFKRILFITSVVAALATGAAHADLYRYVDESGVVHITNVPTSSKYKWIMREAGAKAQPKKTYYYRGYDDMITEAAMRHGVDPALAKAVVKAESNFNAQAVSMKDARGLMQLLPETARRLGVRDIHDPAENIEGGVRHLSRLLKLFSSDIRLAIAAYNAGENAVFKWGAIPPYPETRAYVKRVLLYYKLYKTSNG